MPAFHVARSIHINADPQRVFEVVSDYSTWTKWSPWLCCEPDASVTVSEDPRSVGSMYAWNGTVLGQGEIEHRSIDPGRHIEDEIRFLKPFRSRSDVLFDMEPQEEGTRLTWSMKGSLPWFMFWMCRMMESFIGSDYERGLRMLKEWIETGRVLSHNIFHGVESVGPIRMAGVRRSCSLKDIGPVMQEAFAFVTEKLRTAGQPTDVQGASVIHACDMRRQSIDLTAGLMLQEHATLDTMDLVEIDIPRLNALRVEHVGAYHHLGNAWAAAEQRVRYGKMKRGRQSSFEIYRNSPHTTAVEDLRTDVYIPVR